jgi:hypothetical protein
MELDVKPLATYADERKERERMATISELAGTIARAEGIDPSTVALIARYLREAGLIQKKGRGPSAARMVVSDAANLLIAVNASTTAVEANEVVPAYRELKPDNEGRRSKLNGTFGEALELLIEAAITGKLPDPFLSASVHRDVLNAFEQGKVEISIEFERPDPKARITIQPAVPKYTPSPGYAIAPKHDFGLDFSAMSGRVGQRQKKIGDRKDHTEIGHLTIFSIAKVLQPKR